jgi:hypothetical protein
MFQFMRHIYTEIYLLFMIQDNAATLMRSAIFWGITQRRMVIFYRRFGTPYGSHLQGSSVQRQSFTNVSGQRMGPAFKGLASKGNPLSTFRDNVRVPSSRDKKTFEGGTHTMSRNVDKGLPFDTA